MESHTPQISKNDNDHPLFVSLSNICLDKLVLPGRDPLEDIAGGPGGYATLGARIFSDPPRSRSVGWLLYTGYDFPPAIQGQLEDWDITIVDKRDDSGPCARGLQKYDDDTFGQLTPAFEFSPLDLKETPLLASSSFHLLGTPEMCSAYIDKVLQLRHQKFIRDAPLLVWEPEPRGCLQKNLAATIAAASKINVLSPNHLELRNLFVNDPIWTRPSVIEVEEYSKRLLDLGIGPEGGALLLVRSAELGCLVMSRQMPSRWFPAYHSPLGDLELRAKKGEEVPFNPAVVDPTGAGNAFLGAFTAEYMASGDVIEAVCYAMVAASFVVEQVAFPRKGKDESRKVETWNGEAALERLRVYKDRL